MNANTINSTPEVNGGEKLFTQDEVNRIVSDRLARERERLADSSEFKAKYESVLAELNGLKAAQLRQTKETAYREIARSALDPEKTGALPEKHLDLVVKVARADNVIDAMELDENGAVIDADKIKEAIGREWSDYVVFTTTTGADIAHPPMYMANSVDSRIADAFKPKI